MNLTPHDIRARMETAIRLHSSILNYVDGSWSGWDILYNHLDHAGFPDIESRIAEAAGNFETGVPDRGESFEFIDAVALYAEFIVQHVQEYGRFPSDDQLKVMIDIARRRAEDKGPDKANI